MSEKQTSSKAGRIVVIAVLLIGVTAALAAVTYKTWLIEGPIEPSVVLPDEGSRPVGDAEALQLLQERFNALASEGGDVRPLKRRIVEYVHQYPADPAGHRLIGQLLMASGRAAHAYPHLARSLELDPEQPELALIAGTVAMKRGMLEAAEQHYRSANEQMPESVRALMHMARLRLEQDRLAEAGELVDQALALDASASGPWAVRANIHWRRDKPEEAVAAMEKALKRLTVAEDDQRIPYTLSEAGWLREMGRPGEALQVLLRLRTSQRSRLEVMDAVAACYADLGRPEEAAEMFEAASAAVVADWELAARAARWRLAAGDRAKARHHLDHLRRLKPDAPAVEELERALSEDASVSDDSGR
ncbi:MAG: tetratricopeptide repeat protein [Phycisphaeraceae bacterium]|nr:tetratricopeptide repeat protein [Phycisphaeraceae bacterium]